MQHKGMLCTFNNISKFWLITDGYKVIRPAVARVINEDNYALGIVQYVSNGSVVFSLNESYNSIWPGKQ